MCIEHADKFRKGKIQYFKKQKMFVQNTSRDDNVAVGYNSNSPWISDKPPQILIICVHTRYISSNLQTNGRKSLLTDSIQ